MPLETKAAVPEWIVLAAWRCAMREGRAPELVAILESSRRKERERLDRNHASSIDSTNRPLSQLNPRATTDSPCERNPSDADEHFRLTKARYEMWQLGLLPIDRYGGHDVSNQPRDERGRWVEVGGHGGGKHSPASTADAEGDRLYEDFRKHWNKLQFPGQFGRSEKAPPLTADTKEKFLSYPREEQRKIVASMAQGIANEKEQRDRSIFLKSCANEPLLHHDQHFPLRLRLDSSSV